MERNEHIYQSKKKWSHDNKEKVKGYRKKWETMHPEKSKIYWKKHTIKFNKKHPEYRRKYGKDYRKKQKEIVFNHYGGNPPKCACCGENRIEFLCIDHINGGGTKHRKKVRGGNMTRWIIRHNFPTNFRILCHNCNASFGIYGYCPHNKK